MWAELLVAVALGVVVLLAIPVDVQCRAQSQGVPAFAVRVRWLFGLVALERGRRRPSPPALEQPPAAPEKAPRAPSKGRLRLRAVGKRILFKRVLRLLTTLLRRIQIRRMTARLTVGLDDPADTGILMGTLLPLGVLLRQVAPGELVITPDFGGARMEGAAEADVRVIPLRLVGPAVRFGAWLGLQVWKKRKVTS